MDLILCLATNCKSILSKATTQCDCVEKTTVLLAMRATWAGNYDQFSTLHANDCIVQCGFSAYRHFASFIARTIGEQHPNASLLVGKCLVWLIKIIFYLFEEWSKGINVQGPRGCWISFLNFRLGKLLTIYYKPMVFLWMWGIYMVLG